jgi:parallel beta-helix repeat protein
MSPAAGGWASGAPVACARRPNGTFWWAVEGGRLYVKLEDGGSPIAHVVHVARYNQGIILDSYWHVRGFDIRHFGTGSGGAGVYLTGANGCWIEGNTVYSIGGKGIYLRAGSADNLVERNVCRDFRIGGWPWSSCKSHDEEIQGISQYGNRGNVVRLNTVRGTFDGIDAGDDATENGAADMDINDNTITWVCDDALETEVYDAINVRVWRNRIDGVYSGFSIAPNYVGPQYVLFNTISNGYTTMMGYGASIKNDEADVLVEYLTQSIGRK